MSPSPGLNRGTWLTAAILALAVVASLVSVWYVAGQQRRCLELWGPEAAKLMRHAPTVQAWRVAAEEDAAAEMSGDVEAVEFESRRLKLYDPRMISAARGLSHIRQGLVHDRAFQWNDQPINVPPKWQYALRFSDGDRQTTVLFSFDVPTAGQLENGAIASIAPSAEAFEAFLAEQYLTAATSIDP